MLLSCINDCGNRWGFNLPINVLRGSRVIHSVHSNSFTFSIYFCNLKIIINVFVVQEILEHNFDQLPIHGSGKNHKIDWWKGLGVILLDHGKFFI
jgi:ATP-dependent DNA helicase RecQ